MQLSALIFWDREVTSQDTPNSTQNIQMGDILCLLVSFCLFFNLIPIKVILIGETLIEVFPPSDCL